MLFVVVLGWKIEAHIITSSVYGNQYTTKRANTTGIMVNVKAPRAKCKNTHIFPQGMLLIRMSPNSWRGLSRHPFRSPLVCASQLAVQGLLHSHHLRAQQLVRPPLLLHGTFCSVCSLLCPELSYHLLRVLAWPLPFALLLWLLSCWAVRHPLSLRRLFPEIASCVAPIWAQQVQQRTLL